MTTSSSQSDRMLERVTTHLRAHVAELRRLELAGTGPGELEERRKLIAQLHCQLAGLAKRALAPPPHPLTARQ
jgi:hypothetical protein